MIMEQKIDLVELLKDCPKGMKLGSTLFNGLEFDHIDEHAQTYPIVCRILNQFGMYDTYVFTKYGCYNSQIYSKCVIFPKDKTTWEGFHRPFKNGDIIYNRLQHKICICYLCEDVIYINHCRYNELKNIVFEKLDTPIPIAIQDYRLATEDEKQKLFQAIENNGYKWNEEINALEKLIIPRFKVGDRIKHKILKFTHVITGIKNEYYIMDEVSFPHGILPIEAQNEYELVPNKFDINTLKTFDQVLVRLTNNCIWMPKFFSHYDPKVKYYPFVTLDNMGYPQCIPYKGNEHLSRTTNDCDEFYKIWK